MWHYRQYGESVSTRNESSVRYGYVQDLKGSARYRGSEPVYHRQQAYADGTAYTGTIYAPEVYQSWCSPDERTSQAAYNAAYQRMREKLIDGSQLGATIAEGGDSFRLIESRALSIAKAVRKIRRGDPKGFFYELAVPKHQRRNNQLSKKHWLSGHWLEYWLGVAPLVADIAKSVSVISRENPASVRVKTAAFRDFRFDYGELAPHPDQWPPYIRSECKVMKGMYVQVRVNNPNVYLANQLGLLNPAAIAWELVPFSFVSDWFFNVGDYLQSFDTFFGLTVEDGGTFTKVTYKGFEQSDSWEPPPSEEKVRRTGTFSGVLFNRTAGTSFPLPRPVLELPRLSLTRAATSVALLTQLFLK